MDNIAIKMVVTDLDGTLLDKEQRVSDQDFQTLCSLGKRGVCRVIATGRSFLSLKRVLPDNFPIDYLVFSSGVGVMKWESKKVILAHHLEDHEVGHTAGVLIQRKLDFMIHDPVPENHRFSFIHSGSHNVDFLKRIALYRDYCRELRIDQLKFSKASQLLSITQADEWLCSELAQSLPELNVVRTTSPFDHSTLWSEFWFN